MDAEFAARKEDFHKRRAAFEADIAAQLAAFEASRAASESRLAQQKSDLERRQREAAASIEEASLRGMDGLTDSKKQLTLSEAALVNDIKALQAQVGDAEAEKARLTSSVDALRVTVNSLQRDFGELSAKEQQLRQSRVEVADTEASVQQLQQQRDRGLTTKAQLQKDVAALEADVAALTSGLAAKEADKKRLAADIEAVAALMSGSESELREKRAALQNQQSALSTSVMEAQRGTCVCVSNRNRWGTRVGMFRVDSDVRVSCCRASGGVCVEVGRSLSCWADCRAFFRVQASARRSADWRRSCVDGTTSTVACWTPNVLPTTTMPRSRRSRCATKR